MRQLNEIPEVVLSLKAMKIIENKIDNAKGIHQLFDRYFDQLRGCFWYIVRRNDWFRWKVETDPIFLSSALDFVLLLLVPAEFPSLKNHNGESTLGLLVTTKKSADRIVKEMKRISYHMASEAQLNRELQKDVGKVIKQLQDISEVLTISTMLKGNWVHLMKQAEDVFLSTQKDISLLQRLVNDAFESAEKIGIKPHYGRKNLWNRISTKLRSKYKLPDRRFRKNRIKNTDNIKEKLDAIVAKMKLKRSLT